MNGLERGVRRKKVEICQGCGGINIQYITGVMGGNSIKCGQKNIAHREEEHF